MQADPQDVQTILKTHSQWLATKGGNLEGQRASLRGRNLRGINLSGLDLREADLRETDLQDAVLQGANLMGANLDQAILYDADLQRADLSNVIGLLLDQLAGADLRGARLPESVQKLEMIAQRGYLPTPVNSLSTCWCQWVNQSMGQSVNGSMTH